MAERYKEPLLDLDTLIERPAVTIDGERYEIISPDEISIMDAQRAASLGRKLDNLMKQDGEAQTKVATSTLAEIVAIVMAPVPAEVRERLSDQQKRAVIEVFTLLSLGLKMKRAGATIPQIMKAVAGQTAIETNPPTGEKLSPASSGSTEATPSDG